MCWKFCKRNRLRLDHTNEIAPVPLSQHPINVTIWDSSNPTLCEFRFDFQLLPFGKEYDATLVAFRTVCAALKYSFVFTHSNGQGVVMVPIDRIEPTKIYFKTAGFHCIYRNFRLHH